MKMNPVENMKPADYKDVLQKYNLDALIPEGELVADLSLLDAFNPYDVPVFVWWMGVGTESRETLEGMKELACSEVGGFITPRVPMGVASREFKKEGC